MNAFACRQRASIDGLRKLAVWIDGIVVGRGGSLEPLGTIALSNLRDAIEDMESDQKTIKELYDKLNIEVSLTRKNEYGGVCPVSDYRTGKEDH